MKKKYKHLIGVDEAGRGPLCGPVLAAAVVLKVLDRELLNKVTDSKKLSPKKREQLVPQIVKSCSFAYGSVSSKEIDDLNIFWATQKAFKLALDRLFLGTGISKDESLVLVDGNMFKHEGYNFKCIVKGDLRVPIISAASILAKVKRDTWMQRYDRLFPNYGFASHKGYPTKAHREAIKKYGITQIHRKSFKLLANNDEQIFLFK